MDESDVDGFTIEYIVSPGDFTASVDLVVPELQRRGVYKTSYQEGTLARNFTVRPAAGCRRRIPVAYRFGGAKFGP